MFDFNAYYADRNQVVQSTYSETLTRIRGIHDRTQSQQSDDDRLFHNIADFILEMADYETRVGENYFQKQSFEALLAENHAFRREMESEHYRTSFANPAYAASVFGDELGPMWSSFFAHFRAFPQYAFRHMRFMMQEWNQLFVDLVDHLRDTPVIDPADLKEWITRIERKPDPDQLIDNFKQTLDPQYSYLNPIVADSDLDDLRYLFRYNHYITAHEIRTAEFLAHYPADKLDKLSIQIVNAFINGFDRNRKDVSKKSRVIISYRMGYERIIRRLMRHFQERGLEPVLSRAGSKRLNKQMDYDHRFDQALYLDERFVEQQIQAHEQSVEASRDLMTQVAGHLFFENFGEASFSPEKKKAALQLTPAQLPLLQQYQQQLAPLRYRYMPRSETSFTIISFPSPEIGDQFEAIFEEMLEINMLNTEEYEQIQKSIIDVLDQADVVHVKGKGDNLTDIRVKLQPLTDPSRQTNFLNCGADLNIPVGEVFTSPQLTGTHGTLHFPEVHLRGLRFENLHLTLTDGFVTDYHCTNFENPEDGRKYIEENLLFPHKTLPLGEFAIGTNTRAYVMAKKYDILHLLPILIIEKMGPHFAIGDTCFMMQEDQSTFNRLDQKEVIARENEKSALRTTQPNEAYTFCHTDMTLPYESIEWISAVISSGDRIDILRDGRFVLSGTEILNEPLDTLA